MLTWLSIKNFASFYSETNFDMTATKETNYAKLNTAQTEHDTVLKSAFIFGANASGKSNFIKAFAYLRDIVLTAPQGQSEIIKSIKIHNFAFQKDADNIESEFDIGFVYDNVAYEYGFSILKGKITKEYLYKKVKREVLVFERNGMDITFGKNSATQKKRNKHLIDSLTESTLFVVWLAFLNEDAKNVILWFEKSHFISEAHYSDKNVDEHIIYVATTYLNEHENAEQDRKNVESFVQLANPNIKGLKIDLIRDDNKTNSIFLELRLSFEYEMYDKEELTTETVFLPEMYESTGTIKMLGLSGVILTTLKTGGVIFLDEIDKSLHPLLVKQIIAIFNSIDKNPHNAQLICTAHNVNILEEELRNDQIFFVEKDAKGASEIFKLSSFKGVKKSDVRIKKYMNGHYGATPKFSEHFVVGG